MSVPATYQIEEVAASLKQAAAEALEAESPEAFSFIERQVNVLDARVREVQQAMWATEGRTAARHLEGGQTLTERDIAVIRTFLISDAEGYVSRKGQVGFPQWIGQLMRLMDDVETAASRLDRDSIPDLRGTLKAAIRLMPDIRGYLEEKQRIQQFEVSLRKMDGPSRAALARILREQISPASR